MIDKSFIRLFDNFANAKQSSDPKSVTIYAPGVVIIRSDEFYLQTTNLPEGIAFGDSFEVHLVDCSGAEMADITERVAVFEFIDRSGTPQISFELNKIPNQPKPCHIRFTHPETGLQWWSNAVRCTDSDYIYSTMIAYKGYGYDTNTGLDYTRSDFHHIIRIGDCWLSGISDEQETKGYNQDRGQKVNSRVRIYEMNKYTLQFANIQAARALNRILAQDLLYVEVNGVLVRSTDKPFIKGGELIGASNLLEGEFTTSPDWSDTFTPQLQIFEPLTLVEWSPEGAYTSPHDPPSNVWDDGLDWNDSNTWID